MIKKTATTKIISRFLKLNTNFKNKFDKNVCQNSEPEVITSSDHYSNSSSSSGNCYKIT